MTKRGTAPAGCARRDLVSRPLREVPEQRCACRPEPTRWEFTSDFVTGTTYMRCPACGRLYKLSPAGYVDWHAGVLIDSQHVVGSAWTNALGAFARPSEVTQ